MSYVFEDSFIKLKGRTLYSEGSNHRYGEHHSRIKLQLARNIYNIYIPNKH